ncbi:MAG: DUF2796 domain-containing protein [Thiothrix sp.]
MILNGNTLGLLAVTTALAVLPAMADEHHKHENHPNKQFTQDTHEQHGTHEHGVAALSLAIGDAGLEIMLESPAANLLGFEHTPDTDAEKQKLAAVESKLRAAENLFTLNGEAGCELKDVSIDTAQSEAGHSDMDVAWAYACSKPADLKTVEVKLFSTFPDGFHKIKAEWVTAQGASAQELTQDGQITLP